MKKANKAKAGFSLLLGLSLLFSACMPVSAEGSADPAAEDDALSSDLAEEDADAPLLVSEEAVPPLPPEEDPVGDSNDAACEGALLFVISSLTTLDSLPTRRYRFMSSYPSAVRASVWIPYFSETVSPFSTV